MLYLGDNIILSGIVRTLFNAAAGFFRPKRRKRGRGGRGCGGNSARPSVPLERKRGGRSTVGLVKSSDFIQDRQHFDSLRSLSASHVIAERSRSAAERGLEPRYHASGRVSYFTPPNLDLSLQSSGTWIRTKICNSRGSRPTIRRSLPRKETS